MTTVWVRRVEAPQVVPGGEDLTDSDYVSAFELTAPRARARTPEEWARATFEGAPAPVRWLLVGGWTLVLGLRLGPRTSPAHVLGWPVPDSGPDSITLAAASRLVAARNVVVVDGARVVWVTSVRFHGRVGRAVWAVAAPVHHLAVPFLLGRAGRRG
ncbi:conserved hypothetical protein [Streptomyces himastatinicus ATCC 53653]|uniref:DUF2867 domain-containing protein n=1 Tax=Streptomyces himastatinicus ATCC 53653 TaxID=457427 RepID=D9W9E3_9ACTN|nr:DUF2867 domain-containing protein [Streptomyces himastatinicus]EFL20631.1 conserved hypothetical protein [Streptomyces himastatinicus ATCC 53653]